MTTYECVRVASVNRIVFDNRKVYVSLLKKTQKKQQQNLGIVCSCEYYYSDRLVGGFSLYVASVFRDPLTVCVGVCVCVCCVVFVCWVSLSYIEMAS